MKKALGLVFVLALAATPALAQKVTIDYAHDFDFTKIKTFQYVATEKSDVKGRVAMALWGTWAAPPLMRRPTPRAP